MTLKTKLILSSAVTCVVLLFTWFYTHSFIEVTVANAADSKLSYQLLNQGNLKTSETTTSAKTIKKLVRRGAHEVLVKQGDSSYFAVTKSGGFLAVSKVEASLVVEKSRNFIGNNPKDCMYLVDNVLLSQACGDSVRRLQAHLPANASLPTYIKKNPLALGGFVEGIVTTTEGNIVLVKARVAGNDEEAPHTIYLVGPDGNTSGGLALRNLDKNNLYGLVNYREGFLVYSPSSPETYYYSKRSSQAETINLVGSKTANLKLNFIDTRGESIMVVYSNSTHRALSNSSNPEGEEAHEEPVKSHTDDSSTKSEVAIQNGNQSKHFVFDVEPSKIRHCADNKLCVLDEGRLRIYNISGNKQKLESEITGVISIENSSGGLLVIRGDGVMRFNTDTKKGSIEYAFDEFNYCGIKPLSTTYIVCVAWKDGQRSAILLDPSVNNSDSMDKKAYQLGLHEYVKEVSVYGKFIYVSPNLGEPKYQKDSGGYGYAPETIQSANHKINLEIDRLKIDRNKYTIVNPYD